MEEKEEKKTEVPYAVLNKKERKIKKVKEKKSHRGLAWFLGILTFAGAVYGAKNCYDESDWKYNNEVKSAYTQVMGTLSRRFYYTGEVLEGIRFYEPEEVNSPAHVEVFTTLDRSSENYTKFEHIRYFYELAYEYYNVLKQVEATGDFKNYVEVLNSCFQNMSEIEKTDSYVITNFEFNEEEAVKFNEMFNLNEKGLKQVGFLPQYIEYKKEKKDGINYISYSFKGLSFVEVENGEGDCVLPENMNNAVLSKKLNKKNIKVYETDFLFTYEKSTNYYIFVEDDFITRIKNHCYNTEDKAYNLKVVPTYVHEVDLTSFKMQENSFNFEKFE